MPAVPFLLAGAAFSGAAATIGTAIAASITTAAVSTAAATAIGVGTLSAVATAVQGGSVSDVLKSAVLGGVSSYVGGTIAADIGTSVAQDAFFSAIDAGFAGSAAMAVSNFAGSAITGAITSSFNALISERDPIEAFIKGGLSAGVSSAVSSAVNEVIKDVPGLKEIRGTAAGSAVERALKTSIANSILTNKDFDQSFIESLASSGTGYLLNAAQSTLIDFGKDLIKDSELVKRSEEQVDGLINREKDLVTTINNYIPEVQGIENRIKENESRQNYWAEQANSFMPTLDDLASRANNLNAIVAAAQDPTHGMDVPYYRKAPFMWFQNRIGNVIGDYKFDYIPTNVDMWGDGYSWSEVQNLPGAINTRTGKTFTELNALVNDINSSAEYINNTYPPVKSQFDNAVNNLNNTKAEHSNLTGNYNNAKNTLDEYKTQLGDIREQYSAALEQFNQNYKAYETTLQNFVSAEAQNVQKIENLINDVPQVISSYEADYGRTPTEQELASLITGGNGDIAKGYVSFDANNVSEKEAEAFLGELGYNPTKEEVKQFTGQIAESDVKANIASYVEPKVQKISDVFDYLNQGKLSPEQAQDELLRFGFKTEQMPAIFAANADAVDRSRKAQDIVNDYADIGSDLSREAAVQRLVQEAGVTEAAANNYLSRVDTQVTARNEYQNAVSNYLKGVGDENAVRQAMDAAGLTGDKAESQLMQLRAIREGSELTSSEATNAAVASLDQWQTIDRSGNQIRWARNPEDGTLYVDKARNAQGADITDRFLGATPQSIDKYRVEQQQQYIDRMQKQLTSSAEKYFAPGSKVTADQAIASLKQNDGLTDAMARDVVRQWDQQKEAIAKNSISIDPNTNKTSRILTPEEFESVLSKANVDISGDKFNQRYQAYLYVNGELLRTGNANDGFVLPGEVLEVVNKGKNITPLPTNTFIDQIGKTVLEGIKAGQEVGSPAQNFINSLNANFLSLFPRAGAGIVSVASGDAANDVAVALRGIAKIASDSSDALMPELATESQKWMAQIAESKGPGAKLGAAWQWASDSPTSFGSLAWTAGKELSEDMISFALMGKALKTIGTAPGVALGSALTDFALNYGGVTEENISQLINQGLSSEQAASLAGQGAMPAALAETIVGGIAALVPSAKTAIADLISLPYKATVDGVEEAASYVFNQKGLGQSIDLNDFWTSGVIAATVGGAGHGGASLSVFLSPQGQGQVIKDASDLGLSISQDPFLIPEAARATITSVIGNTAVMRDPSGQTYVADLGNQNITAGQQVNIYSLDTTPVQITPSEMKDYLSLVNQAYQGQLGRNPTADEVGFAIKDLSGVGQLQEKLNATQEGQRFDQLVETFKTTIGRNPTADEIKANITRLGNNEITLNQLKQELAKTNEGVLYEQKQIFNAQTDAQIAANAKSLLDQGKTTYEDFKTFMDSMGLASDRQLNVLDTITPRANVAGTVTSIIGDNAVVTGTDGQMYTMLRVGPNNYLMQVGDQVNLGVSTVKPTATPTVDVTTKIADVIAASVSKSTSISLSQSVSEAAVSTSISKSQSLSVSYSQSQSLSASTSVSVSESQSKSISLSQSVSTVELEKSISLSKSVSTSVSTSASLSTSTSLSQSVSASTSTSQSVSASISKAVSISEALSLSASVSEQMEKDRLKGLSISASLSESISKAVSISESISKAVSISESTSASISTSQSISKATSISQSLSTSTSQSESVSKATSISASVSASTSASLSASTSQSISLSQEVSKQVSISQSTSQSIALSQSLSQSQAVSVSASVSESVSKSASTSLSLSQSTSAALSTSVSQSLSLSQKMSEDIVRGLSISASLSASESVSQSVSRLVSASISASQSASTSLSLSESISKATQLSISNSLSASASVSQSQSLSASQSVSKALSQSVSQSLSLSESVAQSISQSLSLSALQSQSLSVSEQIERDRAVGISISNSLSQSVSLEASKSQSISISTSTQQSISNSVSLSESVSISTYLSQEVSRQTSLSQSLSTANSLSLSLSQSQSLSQSLSQTQTVSITPSITQTVSVTETISPTATVAPSVTESITQTVTQSVTELITEAVTQSLTETLTPSITATITQLPTLAPTITASATIAPSISVTETFTQTPSLTMVITTTSLPPVTTTITIPPVTTTEPVTTEQVTTITIPPVTPPSTSGTIPPVTTPTISIPEQTTTAPVTTLPVTTAPVTSATTTSKLPTTTARPNTGLFPLFGIPAATGQQKTYVDYAQPNVPAPEFGPYDLFKAPSYLRPLQDTGNFGLAALLGAASESQQRNGDNQSQQNAQGQGQAPTG